MDATDIGKTNIKYIFDLLKSGDEHIKIVGHKDIVLLLGNTGSGKTTFANYIAGYDEHLYAEEVGAGTGEYIIIDKDNKISRNSTINSQTIFPELYINEKTRVNFYDCPGFSDSRSAAHDISTTYFIKKVIDSSKGVKLVFVVNFFSVRRGVDRKDFVLLLKHATTFLKDVKKYKDSICLVVTKVDNQYIKSGKQLSLQSDEKVISTIVDFLMTVMNDIRTQSSFPSIHPSDSKEFSIKALELLDAFLEEKGGQYTKIGIFRRPDEPGPISESTLLQKGKKSVENLINKNINFINKDENDFGYTLSSDSKNFVHDLADEINKSLLREVELVGLQVKAYSEFEERNTLDIEGLYSKFKNCTDILLKYEIDSIRDSRSFIKRMFQDVQDLNTSVSMRKLLEILHLDNYLTFLELVSGRALKTPFQWSQGLLKVTTYFQESKKWYGFLSTLDGWLSSYTIQKNIRAINSQYSLPKEIATGRGNEVKLDKNDLKKLVNIIKKYINDDNINKNYNDLEGLWLNETKLAHFQRLLLVTLRGDVESQCVNANKLIIRGQLVKLSDLSTIKCKHEIRFLEIFGARKIFIDDDIIKVGQKTQVTIISPVWEIIADRQIVLDGKPGAPPEKAVAGLHGKPGKPGGPAGNFLGVAGKIIGGNLRLSANGGDGGMGQDGGDGPSGRAGKTRTLSRTQALRTWFNEWGPEEDWDANTEWRRNGNDNRLIIGWYNYILIGTKATDGGPGGDGGHGGTGGNPGTILMSDHSSSGRVTVQATRGAQGPGGKGGQGGPGAPNGNDLEIECRSDRFILIVNTWCNYRTITTVGYSHPGQVGRDGANTYDIKEAETALRLEKPIYTINNYKNYVRELLVNDIWKSYSLQFLWSLERDVVVTVLQDTLGLVNDLEGLENSYFKLNKRVDMKPFYKSLIERIKNYATNPHKNEKDMEHKKTLSTLYSAALSKMSYLNNKHKSNLIIDISKFLDLAIENINHLKTIRSTNAVRKVLEEYKTDIEKKSQITRENIRIFILPEIDNILKNMNSEVLFLINETIYHKTSLENDYGKLREKEFQLENSMIVWYLAKPIKMIADFLLIFEPISQGLAEGVLTGFNTVYDMLIEGDTKNNSLPYLITSMANNVGTFLNNLNSVQTEERSLFLKQLGDISIKMKHYMESSSDNKNNSISKIYQKIIETKNHLDEKKAEEHLPDTLEVQTMREHLSGLLTDYSNLSKNPLQGVGNSTEELNVIKLSQNILDITGLSVDVYNALQNDEENIVNIRNLMNKVNVKITMLRDFEKNIYKIIIPTCKYLKKAVIDAQRDISHSTISELDIRKWKIQNTLRDIKFQIHQLTKWYSAREEILRNIEKLDDTLSTMTDIYIRLDSYVDQANLAVYVADIDSARADDIHVSDRDLKKSLQTLRVSLHSNLVLEQYKRAMNAFSQFVFPFAPYYLNEFNLPETFSLDKTIDNLSDLAANKINLLKNKLIESIITINKYDKFIQRNVKFTSEVKPLSPFYVWKNEQNKIAINKLLDGAEVSLISDITNDLQKNAVKFNEIGIYFKSDNTSLQNELNEIMENYEVIMIHNGNSRYKCGDKIYAITSDKETFRTHTKKYDDGQPIKMNLVADKIKNSEPLLSPYTMWTIKLEHPHDNFRHLDKFKSKIVDLELTGRGQYIGNEVDFEVCRSDLSEYYYEDESLSEFKSIYTNLDHFLGSSPVQSRKKRSIDDSEYARSGTSSFKKSSLINSLFNSFVTGISILKGFNPTEKIRQWMNRDENVRDSYDYDFPSKTDLEYPQYNRFQVSSDDTSQNAHSKAVDINNLSSLDNLVLWDYLIRTIVNKKKRSRSIQNTQNSECSQMLAYSYYFEELTNKRQKALEVFPESSGALLDNDQTNYVVPSSEVIMTNTLTDNTIRNNILLLE